MKFPSLNPLTADRAAFHEIMELFKDLKRYEENEAMSKAIEADLSVPGVPAGARTMTVNGQLFVEAQNDDWY